MFLVSVLTQREEQVIVLIALLSLPDLLILWVILSYTHLGPQKQQPWSRSAMWPDIKTNLQAALNTAADREKDNRP